MNKYFLLLGLPLVLAASFSALRQNNASSKRTYSDSLPLTVVPRDHKGQSVSSSSGAIHFTSGLDNDFYLVNKNGKSGYLYLETRVDRFINEQADRVPLNLCIVIDRSGSMAGEKMDQAKKAAAEILDKLSPDDYVSLVIYDDVVDVLQTPVSATEKEKIKEKIRQVFPRGGTNLWGGTDKGYEQVKRNLKASMINRVLLISDGLANQGLTDPVIIRNKVEQYKNSDGITLSTFGVGLDYNEVLMTSMAENGAGNYYFIDKASAMAAVFHKELNGMMTVAAQNASLKIRLPKGITVKRIYSHSFDQKGDEVTINFRDLFSEETKGVLMEFNIADGTDKTLSFVSTMRFDDVATRTPKMLTNTNDLRPTEEEENYLIYFNRKVREQTVLYQANENMEIAMRETDKGNYEEARRIMSRNASFLNANKEYKAASRELQKMDSVNLAYSQSLLKAESMSTDSFKVLQKASRAKSYDVRAKKN